MGYKIIDVSEWKQINFFEQKELGVNATIIRASFGDEEFGAKDNSFEKNYEQAKEANLYIGAYHYCYAESVTKAEKEAEFFLKCLGNKKFNFPLALVMQNPYYIGLDKNLLTDIILAFCKRIEEAGHYIVIYSDIDWINNYYNVSKLNKYDFWSNKKDNNIKVTIFACGSIHFTDEDYPTIIKNNYFNGYSNSIEEVKKNMHQNIEKENFSSKKYNYITEELEEKEIKVGDKVKIKKGAKTYSGKKIAESNYNNIYSVDELIQDRAILDSKSFCTAFNVKDLIKY